MLKITTCGGVLFGGDEDDDDDDDHIYVSNPKIRCVYRPNE
jgi:hypothetical protein